VNIKNLDILCIIPARCGSKGIPKKNIKLLNGVPLIGYSIKSAKESEYINKIIISTDCEDIKSTAELFNVEVPFLRPKELANDTSLDIDYIKHTLQWLKKHKDYIPDMIVLLRPTTPLRDAKVIDEAIEKFTMNSYATSLRSSHKSPESPFKWFYKKDNYYTTLSDEYTLKDTNRPRQSFDDVYIPNGYVDIIKLDTVIDLDDMYGDKILSFTTKLSYEIDTLEEFNYIEYKLKGNK
jgi:CMP-N-acetylneuraminic acid synthetase